MWGDDAITIANPGDCRLPIEEARKPGASDPRNETMLKIFSFMNVGERAGSGMGAIENGWTAGEYAAPSYEVAYGPDRTTLTLPLVSAEKKSAEIGRNGRESAKDVILVYLGEKCAARRIDLESATGLKTSRVNDLLRELISDGSVVAEGATRDRRYRLAD